MKVTGNYNNKYINNPFIWARNDKTLIRMFKICPFQVSQGPFATAYMSESY